jgi:hypothetical protein
LPHLVSQYEDLDTRALHSTIQSILNSAFLIQVDLIAERRGSSIRIITERIANGILGHKHEELVVWHRQTELRVNVIVGLRSLVTGTAGTVEG